MIYHRNEGAQAHPNLLSITIETEYEPKAADSVIRVALASLGTVKEIKVIGPEATTSRSGAEKRKLFAYKSDSKPQSELKRFLEVVGEANRPPQQPVHVPLSGICVGDGISFHCRIPDPNAPAHHSYHESFDRAAQRFMAFLIDQASMLERQRSKMLIEHYFFDRLAAETITRGE